MNSPFDDLHPDHISRELDTRKLQRLVDNGTLEEDILANAPIFYTHCPNDCDTGMEGNPLKCIGCGAEGVSEEVL